MGLAMKLSGSLLLIIILFCTASPLYGQASNYFPQQEGFRWRYMNSTLYSADSIINELETYHTVLPIDTIEELQCYPIQSDVTAPAPPIISYYIALDGNDALMHTNLLPTPINSMVGAPSVWLTAFKFGTISPSLPWIILDWDTTFQFDSLSIPVEVKITGQRISFDQSVTVPSGTYSTVRFNIKEQIGTSVVGNFIPLITLVDTFWIAENIWTVKHTRDAVSVSIGDSINFFIPGVKQELLSWSGPDAVRKIGESPQGFHLSQNYPNPFNPATKLSFVIGHSSFVTIKVFNILGKEAATLLHSIKYDAGSYEIPFDASQLPSGVYFYRIEAFDDSNHDNAFVQVKKMVLIQ